MESTSKLNLTHRLYEKEPRNGQRSLIAIVQKELPNFDKLRLITYFISVFTRIRSPIRADNALRASNSRR